ncbi:hypothetical protein SAMN05216404_10135 [Nitrosospira multiformis]|uniref:Uncharacterized protein n=1 Tax=Nitrosospira multiformis TaxID=1231 RepID=A0A1H8AUE7_9PROT|nr:hypothetical protein SAMN05216404_10135 [Nitrosospira multiformis]
MRIMRYLYDISNLLRLQTEFRIIHILFMRLRTRFQVKFACLVLKLLLSLSQSLLQLTNLPLRLLYHPLHLLLQSLKLGLSSMPATCLN